MNMEHISSVTQYRGICRNNVTGEDDELFQTSISELLCRNRTVEKANMLNELKSNSFQYNIETISIQMRIVESYASQWKDSTLLAAQTEEAVLRMKKLKLHNDVLSDFQKEGKLYRSEGGNLYWLNEQEQRIVEEWQNKTGCMVYHVIKNRMIFGLCYSLLYVSPDQEEWELDRVCLDEGYPLVYIKNIDDERYLEFGSIGVKPMYGGVIRTD